MLSGLKIKADIVEPEKPTQTFTWTYNANTLLSYLQQVWPGVETAIGNGSKASPYEPKSAKQWFYCAKLKGSGVSAKRFPNLTNEMAWFKVGGRFIAIDPVSLYASDYGTTGDAVTLAAPTYPNLKDAVENWQRNISNTNKLLTAKMRDLMEGKMIMEGPDALPVLTVVLFISEVARNHTAFHTNLMALDLIEQGLGLPTTTTPINWTWSNAIWITDACPDCAATGSLQCSVCHGSGISRPAGRCTGCGGVGTLRPAVYCNKCRGTGIFTPAVNCKLCRGSGFYYNSRRRMNCGGCGGTGIFKPAEYCRWCRGTGIFKPAEYCGTCGGSGISPAVNCNTCRGTGNVKCSRCKGRCRGTVYDEYRPKGVTTIIGSATFKGGAQALQNGLLPMSHKASAFGSAFDLTGTGTYKLVKDDRSIGSDQAPSELMVVRRKEASILIQWLQYVIDDMEIQFSKTQTLKVSATLDKTDLILTKTDITNSYQEVTQCAESGRTLDDDTGTGNLANEVKDAVRAKIIAYLQIRAESLWFAFK